MFTGTINVNGHLMDLSIPRVMGIVNLTPDSFFEGSRTPTEKEVKTRVTKLLAEGADIIDVGAYSSRPGADDVPVVEEMKRLLDWLVDEAQQMEIPIPLSKAEEERLLERWGKR